MKNIATALLKVQKELDPVHKGRKGYGYNYADLPAVMDSCLEALNDAGILVVQSPTVSEKQAAAIYTRLIHAETGEEITSTIEVPWAIGNTKMSDAQAYGSAMTYARRYALVAMLGIVTEDDDGASAGNKRPQRAEPSAEDKARAFLDKLDADLSSETDPDKTYQIIEKAKAALERAATYPSLKSRAVDYLAVIGEVA